VEDEGQQHRLETAEQAVSRRPTISASSGKRPFGGSRFLLSACAALLLAGCGYHLARPGHNLPVGIRRIAVPVLKNETMEPGLEALLTDQIRRRFAESGWAMVADPDRADALLVATIAQFTATPISFSTTSFAAEYRATMVVAVKLIDRDGKTLWADRALTKVREYLSSTDIAQTEYNKQVAIGWLTAEISKDIHDRIFDGFP
jgi:outer membrane lipopolysaccharide assembly protein LptE/RlpB